MRLIVLPSPSLGQQRPISGVFHTPSHSPHPTYIVRERRERSKQLSGLISTLLPLCKTVCEKRDWEIFVIKANLPSRFFYYKIKISNSIWDHWDLGKGEKEQHADWWSLSIGSSLLGGGVMRDRRLNGAELEKNVHWRFAPLKFPPKERLHGSLTSFPESAYNHHLNPILLQSSTKTFSLRFRHLSCCFEVHMHSQYDKRNS